MVIGDGMVMKFGNEQVGNEHRSPQLYSFQFTYLLHVSVTDVQ